VQAMNSAASAPSLAIDVALTTTLRAREREPRAEATYIVVDVIRATTTLSVLFEQRCEQVLLAPSIEAVRAARLALGAEVVLAGEVGGAQPPGFDLGNSPAEVARSPLRGKTIVFATTNGTRAMRTCEGGRRVLVGCLRNANAVCAAAVQTQLASARAAAAPQAMRAPTLDAASEVDEIGRPADIMVVCSGRGGLPAYDDTLCAGYLVHALLRSAATHTVAAELGEGARIAAAVYEAAERAGPLRDALATADAARAIARIGLAGDLDWCAAVDATDVVPELAGDAPVAGLLTVRAVSRHG
jgi:2-phosphosulfolactate phosphatase